MKTTLDQWQVLRTIVEEGGFAQAAEKLHRSQSSVSYAVARLQEQLEVALLRQDGRRMRLTGEGEVLLREAAELLRHADRLERRAGSLRRGWEPELKVALDSLLPAEVMLAACGDFAGHCRETRLQLHEVVMSGADDALYQGDASLAVAGRVPQGFLGDWLLDAEFIACAAPGHRLHALGGELDSERLRGEVQVVLRDSGIRQPRDEGWLGAHQRWTVSQPETGIAMVEAGLAFGWLARHRIRRQLAEGSLKPLPLKSGAVRKASLHLVLAEPSSAGPACLYLAEALRRAAADWRSGCAQ
ncbi:LysR family transcriptional regulator [Chromobacterium piscinae]|uniref:LysR family transcriptional regulator n=1 Tax=Chromobacterium piscinae TaxID=686831 RepID=UPI001C8B6324|nr:LysR family transcriptional regulator [Chromobacterium piscinae]MBX9348536.1 LysR family transcriptional regulator [Chromobacterium vaccinii]MCD4505062.1 LysR family transcriptional regulator [Chromobacterium piscinae]MCD5326478.1 LysR family transcriptional regulator [Chromobacterium piscinae]